MGVSDPLPAGFVIWFGSLEFRATDNGYLMQLLSPIRNPVTPTSPAQRNRRSGQHSRGCYVATQCRGRRGHRFIITCLGVICAGTVTCCSTSVSQGGLDLAVADRKSVV